MVSEIKGPAHQAIHQAGQRQTTSTERGSNTALESTAQTRDEVVSLTDLAARLQQLTNAVSELPEVDQQRVARFRDAINSGEYSVDDRSVADKLTELESALVPPRA